MKSKPLICPIFSIIIASYLFVVVLGHPKSKSYKTPTSGISSAKPSPAAVKANPTRRPTTLLQQTGKPTQTRTNSSPTSMPWSSIRPTSAHYSFAPSHSLPKTTSGPSSQPTQIIVSKPSVAPSYSSPTNAPSPLSSSSTTSGPSSSPSPAITLLPSVAPSHLSSTIKSGLSSPPTIETDLKPSSVPSLLIPSTTIAPSSSLHCQSSGNGEYGLLSPHLVYVSFKYQIQIDETADVGIVLSQLEHRITDMILPTLFSDKCGNTVRRNLQASDLNPVGVAGFPNDIPIGTLLGSLSLSRRALLNNRVITKLV
jgi:hypothetical protein